MKKTLIALAVLAASGASFAQSAVTLGGTYSFGFQKGDNGATKADLIDSRFNLSGTEDLGGGLKASFLTDIQVGGRANLAPTTVDTKSSNVWARNAIVTLNGPFGTVAGGRVEGSNLHQSAQLAAASLADGFDKAGFAGALSNYSTISYTSPAMNGFNVSVGQLKALDTKFAPAANVANEETTVVTLGATYAAGPLSAGFVRKTIDTYTSSGNKTELFGTYDLGVAKVGLGYGKNSGAAYAGEKATVIASAVVPMGALSLGVDYGQRKAGGTSASVDAQGYAVAANYALSKRTKINATIGKVEGTGLTGAQQYRVGLFHNF